MSLAPACATGNYRGMPPVTDVPTIDPVVWNPFDPVMRSDPYPVYHRLLAEDPVHENPLGMVVLTRFADCETMLRRPSASSDESKSPTFQDFVLSTDDPEELQRLMEMRPFLF